MTVIITDRKAFSSTNEVHLAVYDHIHGIKIDEWLPTESIAIIDLVVY